MKRTKQNHTDVSRREFIKSTATGAGAAALTGFGVEEAKAEVHSAQEALRLTQEQFTAGTATSLDLSQAERDAFQAEANAAQSKADLAFALLQLQKATGQPLLEK